MKGSTRFVLAIGVFLVLVFILQMNMPRQFRWSKSFHHSDDQPFGCELFDRMLTASLPNGYEVSNRTFATLAADTLAHGRSYLVIADYLEDFDSLTITKMLYLVGHGSKVMLCAMDWNKPLTDSLELNTSYNWFSVSQFRQATDTVALCYRHPSADTLQVLSVPEMLTCRLVDRPMTHITDSTMRTTEDGDTIVDYEWGRVYDEPRYQRDTLLTLESVVDKVSFDDEGLQEQTSVADNAVMVHFSIGQGDLYVCSLPLLFTNYGMLEGYDGFIFSSLHLLADRPVVRLESYMQTSAMWSNESSPTRHFLKFPPLKWALRLTMLAILLFMVFTARRRERVTPVYEAPRNRQLEFIQLIGTLYHQRHDNADLVRKKYRYFAEDIRRQTGIDITDDSDDEHTIRLLADKAGMEAAEVKAVILRSRMAGSYDGPLDDRSMRAAIDEMNRLLMRIQE